MKVTEEREETAKAEKNIITGRRIKMKNFVRHKKAEGKEKTDS